MKTEITWSKSRVNVRYYGDCSDAQILRVVVALQADYRFDSVRQALHDFGQCQELASCHRSMEEIAIRNVGAKITNPQLKIAVIPNTPTVQAMVARFATPGLDSYPIRIFDNEDSANIWLGAL